MSVVDDAVIARLVLEIVVEDVFEVGEKTTARVSLKVVGDLGVEADAGNAEEGLPVDIPHVHLLDAQVVDHGEGFPHVDGNLKVVGETVAATVRDDGERRPAAHQLRGYLVDGAVSTHRRYDIHPRRYRLAGNFRPVTFALCVAQGKVETAAIECVTCQQPDIFTMTGA